MTNQKFAGIRESVKKQLAEWFEKDGRGADTAPDLARRSKVPQYATKQLVEWFAAETERRYISQNDLLNQMKLIYPPRADFITTTWLQNFCRNKPQMSGI